MLKIVELNKEFVVCTDACKRGLGRVIMQERQVVCNESQKLNGQEVYIDERSKWVEVFF